MTNELADNWHYYARGSHDPIAYTANADTFCPECAEKLWGRSERGFIAEDAHDDEANPVGAIFEWDEWYEPTQVGRQVLACGRCGAECAETN